MQPGHRHDGRLSYPRGTAAPSAHASVRSPDGCIETRTCGESGLMDAKFRVESVPDVSGNLHPAGGEVGLKLLRVGRAGEGDMDSRMLHRVLERQRQQRDSLPDAEIVDLRGAIAMAADFGMLLGIRARVFADEQAVGKRSRVDDSPALLLREPDQGRGGLVYKRVVEEGQDSIKFGMASRLRRDIVPARRHADVADESLRFRLSQRLQHAARRYHLVPRVDGADLEQVYRLHAQALQAVVQALPDMQRALGRSQFFRDGGFR